MDLKCPSNAKSFFCILSRLSHFLHSQRSRMLDTKFPASSCCCVGSERAGNLCSLFFTVSPLYQLTGGAHNWIADIFRKISSELSSVIHYVCVRWSGPAVVTVPHRYSPVWSVADPSFWWCLSHQLVSPFIHNKFNLFTQTVFSYSQGNLKISIPWARRKAKDSLKAERTPTLVSVPIQNFSPFIPTRVREGLFS